MSKSKLIKDGKNIEIDGGITIINEGISLAEKVEEKAPEVANCLTSVYPNFFFRKRLRKNTRGL